MTDELDLLRTPLDGTNLVEASAGTGKTYALAALYIRFILEKELSPEQVLVVTFTEAATKELRARIRNVLRDALEAFSGMPTGEGFLSNLVAKTSNPYAALTRLTQALRDFDRAAIFTIHGFCQRVLFENAFESSCLFDTELITNEEDLKREILDDFWRIHFYQAPIEVVRHALGKGYSPDYLLAELGRTTATPDTKVVPQMEPPPSPDAMRNSLQEILGGLERVHEIWHATREVVSVLLKDPGLNATSYGNPSKTDESTKANLRDIKVAELARNMEDYLGSRDPVLPLPLFKGFELFTAAKLAKSTKKSHVTPSHEVFDLCEAINQKASAVEEALDRYLLYIKAEAFKYLQEELPVRKQRQNVQHFDDLLLKLKKALEQSGGEELASSVREKYSAALIDEFQDTDPVQYAIFHHIFRGEDRGLFLIGDPKQAIYSFRGADLFTYMEAAHNTDKTYTLGTNWRSEPDLIQAVNTLFSTAQNQFVYREISFLPVSPPPGRGPEPLVIKGQPEPPFQLWFVERSMAPDAEKPIHKEDAQKVILRAVAAEISRLLALGAKDQAFIGETPLRASDMAVLVRTNEEARLTQQALAALRIPSVLYSTEDVFDSAEAEEMERVLAAVAEPHREGLVRAALAMDMIGMSGEDLASLMPDEAQWEDWVVRFQNYFRLWNEHGFMRMFRHLLLNEKVRTRLVSHPNGERRITNLLHIAEVLHQESVERKLGVSELLKWLSEQRDPNFRRDHEHQLRLESDENAVKLVTIHKSKGLEYPIVFCPFSWGSSRLRAGETAFTFHDENDGRRLTLDLGSAEREANRVFAEKERLAENMRLLYVALTRAKKRCYLAWGPFNTAGSSALAYLFHHRGATDTPDIVSEMESAFKKLNDEAMLVHLREIEKRSAGTVQLRPLPLAEGIELSLPDAPLEGSFSCRTFDGRIDRSWRISSFSALVSDRLHGAEMPDRDETDLVERKDVEEIETPPIQGSIPDIFQFPRGPKPGTLLHDILEHLDFTERDPDAIGALVTLKLKEYGFETRWQPVLCNMIRKVLSAPLGRNGESFSLSSIGNEDRLNELEFYYPIELLTPALLKSAFAAFMDPSLSLEKLSFNPVKGFMKGFIDLVFRFGKFFYLIDWKSNHLGNRVEDYGREALASAMGREYYVLQYHLYTVALDRYLALRMPDYQYERNFGGVYYLFLRGIDPGVGPDYGVFFARPGEELIQALRLCVNQKENDGDT